MSSQFVVTELSSLSVVTIVVFVFTLEVPVVVVVKSTKLSAFFI